jgi:nucleoside-diphosphate-sugar epimerase
MISQSAFVEEQSHEAGERVVWPRILVTGATGFIGGWVVEALCEAGAADIRAGVRRKSARLERLPAKTVYCDIMDILSLTASLQGVEVVINCVRDHTDGATIEGTRGLLDAARSCGVKRIVQMSSIAVYGNSPGVVTEREPKAPVNRYGEEKDVAEELCRAASGPDFTIAVVRPALVYGPYGEEWTARFIREIATGRLQQLGAAGQGDANLIFAGDLGRFAAQLAIKSLPPFSVYNANGAEIPTFDAYFDQLSQAMGRGPLPLTSRPAWLFGLRRLIRRAIRMILRPHKPAIQKLAESNQLLKPALEKTEKLFEYDVFDEPRHRFAQNVVYSNDLAQSIGFQPKTSLEEGVTASVQWAQAEHLTKSAESVQRNRPLSQHRTEAPTFYRIEYFRKAKPVGATSWFTKLEEAKLVAADGLSLHRADFVRITDLGAGRAQVHCIRKVKSRVIRHVRLLLRRARWRGTARR